ncbi:hypothetical protein [Mucilaginibacter sp.]|uniref:hypothetical protein n=1 Tax=Mucilaginibacter sp. TaxID=1882438 RepID=UPI0025EB9685|nr:hypothetical protein [Mucilaginibacter sp.]
MILVSEVVHPGEVHLEFNAALLQVFSSVYPNESFIYRAEDEQLKLVKERILTPLNIEFCGFDSYYDPKAFSWPARIFGEIKEIYRSLRLGEKRNVSTYLWTCLFPTGHLFLSLYLFIFRSKKAKHLIVLHGELEFLKSANRKKTTIAFGVMLKLAINLGNKTTRYIVLGDRIKGHLESYFSNNVTKRIITILHPYSYHSDYKQVAFDVDKTPLTLGAIGTQMLSKNSNLIFELARILEKEIARGALDFRTIGKVLPEISPFTNKLVNQRYPDAFVPNAIFETEVGKLDFVLFFYSNDSYQLCASGAIFEVIKLGIPIISIYNDYFDWLFNDYGEMGFLCKDINEMSAVILNIVNGKLTTEIDVFVRNIETFKTKNNLQSIATDLATKL